MSDPNFTFVTHLGNTTYSLVASAGAPRVIELTRTPATGEVTKLYFPEDLLVQYARYWVQRHVVAALALFGSPPGK